MNSFDTDVQLAWQQCAERYALTDTQVAQLKKYCDLLIAWNKVMDLTAVTSVPAIITHHFEDSLAMTKFVKLSDNDCIADVGSGAGFPGIPLKIYYPNVRMVLIEVLAKRVDFLQTVINELGLTNIEISTLDWRTFLRTTHYPITYVCARASLRPDELVRMFKSSSPYKNATLIYWASDKWVVGSPEAPFLQRQEEYTIDDKRRKLVFFGRSG